MSMKKLTYEIIGLVSSLLLATTACVSSENLIVTEYETLNYPTSTLMYEYSFTTSSATGKCTGNAIDRWYGSEAESGSVLDIFEQQLPENGWEMWPEDVTRIWRKEDRDGLFTFSIHMFALEEEIDPNRAYYTLPDSILLQATEYQTVYVITMSHMSSTDATRCFRP